MSISSADVFNAYLLRAVTDIHSKWSLRGYASAAYTHDLTLGHIKFKATKPPYTMCVAAQMEIIVTALNLYLEDGGDKEFLDFLPASQWQSLAPGTFKDSVWVNTGSSGTAWALEKFGMGVMVPFSDLTPGCFINLNRTKGSGHAVLFLSYLDAKGNELSTFSSAVAGFKYYSSQGGLIGGGFDYRYAFFEGTAPTLGIGKKRDLGVIRSTSQKLLNCGYMYLPTLWNASSKDAALSEIHGWEAGENEVNPIYLDQMTDDD